MDVQIPAALLRQASEGPPAAEQHSHVSSNDQCRTPHVEHSCELQIADSLIYFQYAIQLPPYVQALAE